MKREAMPRILLGIIALGCVWGLMEALTFGGLLHQHWGGLFQYHLCPCFLMAAIFGSLVMGLALAIYKKPATLVGIGLIAAAFCFLAIPFLPTAARSTTYGPVVASATAAVIGSLSLALVASFLKNRLHRNITTRIGIGALAAIIAATLFILATAHGLDKPICADLGYARPLPDFLGIGGMLWVIAAAIMFPAGYSAGARLQYWLTSHILRRPLVSYAASAATIAFSCIIGALAFAIGL